MGSLVLAHVDEFGGLLHSLESGFDDRFGAADEGDDGAVGGFAGVDVEQADAARPLDGRSDAPDHLPVASFAEIGDALYDSLFHDYDCVVDFSVPIQM